jgi:hypothetical protein
MAIGGAAVGPLKEDTRDRIKRIRDREGFSNYEETLTALAEIYDSSTNEK